MEGLEAVLLEDVCSKYPFVEEVSGIAGERVGTVQMIEERARAC